jgi:hypothetical protein
MANNNIAGRFYRCRDGYSVLVELNKYLSADFKWYLQEYKNLIPGAVSRVSIHTYIKTSYDGYRLLHICATTWDGKYKYNKTIDEIEAEDFITEPSTYDSLLWELYYSYDSSYYKYAFAEQIAERRRETAQAIVAMFSPYSGQKIKPLFCSCCGAKLTEDSNKCEYCGATYSLD